MNQTQPDGPLVQAGLASLPSALLGFEASSLQLSITTAAMLLQGARELLNPNRLQPGQAMLKAGLQAGIGQPAQHHPGLPN